MSESSFALEAKATLFKARVLAIMLLFSLILFSGNFIAHLDTLWSVCGLIIGLMALDIVRRHRIFTQHNVGSFEATQLLIEQALSDPASRNTESEAFAHSIAWSFKNAPAYCTPLEMLNSLSSETSKLDDQDAQTTVSIVPGFKDDCTFATSPFTSPPMCTMEIFVRQETVVYEDITGSIPSGTPSPLTLDHELPDVTVPPLTELIKYCEAAIMESNMRDTELL